MKKSQSQIWLSRFLPFVCKILYLHKPKVCSLGLQEFPDPAREISHNLAYKRRKDWSNFKPYTTQIISVMTTASSAWMGAAYTWLYFLHCAPRSTHTRQEEAGDLGTTAVQLHQNSLSRASVLLSSSSFISILLFLLYLFQVSPRYCTWSCLQPQPKLTKPMG